ncbi:MAG: outer membrane protein-like protein [Flavipsychrobacter sp.]|jgi:putative membrane protein|nr:outer membrane protein-like protein [Flavipsychrobacter sp.]
MNYRLINIITVLIVSVLFTFAVSCGNNTNGNNGTSDSSSTVSDMADSVKDALKDAQGKVEEVATQAGSAVSTALRKNPDSAFTAEMMERSGDEIEMLQVALTKATSKNLKVNAKRMLADHKKIKTEVEAYATKHNYPTVANSGKGQKMLDDISDKTGTEWDKAWLVHMFHRHESAIGNFEGAKGQVEDAAVKAMIEKALPTLRTHLEMVKKLQADIK